MARHFVNRRRIEIKLMVYFANLRKNLNSQYHNFFHTIKKDTLSKKW